MVKLAAIVVACVGVEGRSGESVALGQLRATRRREVLNIRWQTRRIVKMQPGRGRVVLLNG